MHSPTWLRRVTLPCTVLVVGLLIAGCGIFSPDETKDDKGGGGGTFVDPTTPELMMENFKNAWDTMNKDEYIDLLHTEFQFFFDPGDNLEQYIGTPVWNLDQERQSVTSMFTNQPGVDPVTQEAIPPIASISVESFVPLDTGWQIPPGGDDPENLYYNTVRQRFMVSINVSYQGDGSSTRVSGENRFYAVNIGTPEAPNWQLKIWEDVASGSAGN